MSHDQDLEGKRIINKETILDGSTPGEGVLALCYKVILCYFIGSRVWFYSRRQMVRTKKHDILTKVVSECELCIRFQKTPSRPAVSLPMASDWNELVAVDLHQLEQSIWYLHIIDIFTRFSAGAIVKTKDASVVGDKIINNWTRTSPS